MRDLARRKNPNIKIFAQQWWGHHDYMTLETDKFGAYANSVAQAIEAYNLDGYDCDYEPRDDNRVPGGNVIEHAPDILKKIRIKFNELGKKHSRRYYISVSASRINYLGGDLHQHIDYINMQTYSGGTGHVTVQHLIGEGYKYKKEQLLWGVEAESPAKNQYRSLDEIKTQLVRAGTKDHLAGFHLWRLTSEPAFVNRVQLYLWKLIHGQTNDEQFEKTLYADWNNKSG